MVVDYTRARAAIEALYEGKCTIYVREKRIDPDTRETRFIEAALLTDAPCRLSFRAFPATYIADHAPQLGQAVRLFLSPTASVPPGSRIVVSQNGVTREYENSGEPARYPTHQEIALELLKGRA